MVSAVKILDFTISLLPFLQVATLALSMKNGLNARTSKRALYWNAFLSSRSVARTFANIMSGGQNPPSRLGSKHSADQKQKLTKAQKAAWAKSGYRDKMKAMRKAASAKPGAWEKKSAFLKVAFAKPAEKERKSKAAKREMDRPERKEQSRAVLTALWKSMSPEQRAQRAQKTLATRRANLAYCQIVAK